jgi:hypothetical protein
VILNGHEYVACEARKAGRSFTKEADCFTTISDAAGLAKIADTLSEPRAIGRLTQVCERWIYTCLYFALDFDQHKRSGFRYQYSNYQVEYSRNLVFQVGGHLDQVFQALIDRSRAPLDLKSIKTILGYRRRPKYRRTKRSAEWEVTVKRPAYDLTIFKLHCGKLTLKIYNKGERVLRIEAVAHSTQELNCGRSLEKFPEVVSRLKGHRHRRDTACHPRSRPRRDLCLPSSHRTALYGIRHAARPRIPASGARPRGPQARIAPPDSRGSLHNARVPPMDPLDDSLPPQCSRSPRDQPRKAHFNSAVSRRPVKINSFLIFVGQSRNRVTALHLKVV